MDELLSSIDGGPGVLKASGSVHFILSYLQLNQGRKRNKNFEKIKADLERQKRKEGQTNWRER